MPETIYRNNFQTKLPEWIAKTIYRNNFQTKLPERIAKNNLQEQFPNEIARTDCQKQFTGTIFKRKCQKENKNIKGHTLTPTYNWKPTDNVTTHIKIPTVIYKHPQ
jgi:hypothetical protein